MRYRSSFVEISTQDAGESGDGSLDSRPGRAEMRGPSGPRLRGCFSPVGAEPGEPNLTTLAIHADARRAPELAARLPAHGQVERHWTPAEIANCAFRVAG